MFSALELKLVAGLAALAAVLVMFGLYTAHEREVGAAAIRAQAAEQALTAAQDSIRETNRRTDAVQQKAIDADHAASAARADADAAAAAGDRLRERIAALNRAGAGHPAAAASSPANASADTVSADLFASVVYSAGRYAAIADAARIAGQACEQSYDALTVR